MIPFRRVQTCSIVNCLPCADTLNASEVQMHNPSMSVTEELTLQARDWIWDNPVFSTRSRATDTDVLRSDISLAPLNQPKRMGCAEGKQRRVVLSMALGVGKSALLAQNGARLFDIYNWPGQRQRRRSARATNLKSSAKQQTSHGQELAMEPCPTRVMSRSLKKRALQPTSKGLE